MKNVITVISYNNDSIKLPLYHQVIQCLDNINMILFLLQIVIVITKTIIIILQAATYTHVKSRVKSFQRTNSIVV